MIPWWLWILAALLIALVAAAAVVFWAMETPEPETRGGREE